MYLVEEIKGFENAEYRSYTFADCEEAVLIPLETGQEKVQEPSPTDGGEKKTQ